MEIIKRTIKALEGVEGKNAVEMQTLRACIMQLRRYVEGKEPLVKGRAQVDN
jgi:hypothetical protein